jgi:hypothetical protein
MLECFHTIAILFPQPGLHSNCMHLHAQEPLPAVAAFLDHFEDCLQRLTAHTVHARFQWSLNSGVGPVGGPSTTAKQGKQGRHDKVVAPPTQSGAAVVAVGACHHLPAGPGRPVPADVAGALADALVPMLGSYLPHPTCWRVEQDPAADPGSMTYLLKFDPAWGGGADPPPSPLVSYGTLLHSSPAFKAWDYLVRGALPSLTQLLYPNYSYLCAANTDEVVWPEWERLKGGQRWLPAPLTPDNPVVATCCLPSRVADMCEPKLKAVHHVDFTNAVGKALEGRLASAMPLAPNGFVWTVTYVPVALKGNGSRDCGGVLELRLLVSPVDGPGSGSGSEGMSTGTLHRLESSGVLEQWRATAPPSLSVQVGTI